MHRQASREGHHLWLKGHAMVPLIPPAGIKVAGGLTTLSRYHILWEVERWAMNPQAIAPDRDPFLLRHLGGEMYAVLYEWDLTDVERAVMAAFRREDA